MTATATPDRSAAELLAAAGIAEDPAYYGPFTTDAEKVVLTIPMRIQAAWKANDADAFADVFTSNGSLLMSEQLTSRLEIRSYMRAGFTGVFKGAHVKGWPVSVRFLCDDVALVVTEGGIIMAGETQTAPERRIRAVWVIVQAEGAWRLMSHQSSPVG